MLLWLENIESINLPGKISAHLPIDNPALRSIVLGSQESWYGSGWDVQWGIDATDGEYDCGGSATASSSNYFMISVREGGSSEAYTTTFSYRYKNVADFPEPWWDALHTADTLDSVASAAPTMASSFGDAFDCVVDGTCRTPPPSPPGAWEKIDLKLVCTNGGI